jgi:hypothetical protein
MPSGATAEARGVEDAGGAGASTPDGEGPVLAEGRPPAEDRAEDRMVAGDGPESAAGGSLATVDGAGAGGDGVGVVADAMGAGGGAGGSSAREIGVSLGFGGARRRGGFTGARGGVAAGGVGAGASSVTSWIGSTGGWSATALDTQCWIRISPAITPTWSTHETAKGAPRLLICSINGPLPLA